MANVKTNPRRKRKVSLAARRFIGRTIRKLAHERTRRAKRRSPAQREAIAYAKARRAGYRVPRTNPRALSEAKAWQDVRDAMYSIYNPSFAHSIPRHIRQIAERVDRLASQMERQLARGVHENPALAIVGGNPPMGRVVEIRYHRNRGAHPGYYKHVFKRRPVMVALHDGSLKIGPN